MEALSRIEAPEARKVLERSQPRDDKEVGVSHL